MWASTSEHSGRTTNPKADTCVHTSHTLSQAYVINCGGRITTGIMENLARIVHDSKYQQPSTVCMTSTGKLYCRPRLPDYIPPLSHALEFWVDFGDTVVTDRCPVAEFMRRPPLYATGAMCPLSVHPFVVCDPRISSISLRKRRNILDLTGGAISFWGRPSANWTISLFMRLDRPAGDCGSYPGVGPITAIYFPHLDIRVTVPSGGAIPGDALELNGGPLDGVRQQWPWDAALVNQWRHLVVTNNAATGVRTVLIDGYVVVTEPASTQQIPHLSPIGIFPGPLAVSLAEVAAWHTADLSKRQILSLLQALQEKWDVWPAAPPDRDLLSTTFRTRRGPRNPPVFLPRELPPPYCWIDSLSAFRDREGTQKAQAYQTIQTVVDRGTGGCDVFFPFNQTILATGPFDAVNGTPVIQCSGCGTFKTSPLPSEDGGSYTIVAAWRCLDGAHPFAVREACRLGPQGWWDWIGSDSSRTMPTPQIARGDVCVATWQFKGPDDGLTWSFAASSLTVGFWWSGPSDGSRWVQNANPQIGNAGKELQLCEIIVWHEALAPGQLAALSYHLLSRWGVGLSLGDAIVELPSTAPPDSLPEVWFDAQDASTLCMEGDVVLTWRSKGAIPDYALMQTEGDAILRPGLCGPGMHGLEFTAYRGRFTDGTITRNNRAGLTLMMVGSNFRGTPSDSPGTTFWYQSIQDYCFFHYPHLGTSWFYEQMGNDGVRANHLCYGDYTAVEFPEGVFLYAVRADALLDSTRVYVNRADEPLMTGAGYGTINLLAPATVGSDTECFRSNVADFRLWCRRMEDNEFLRHFEELRTFYNIP